MYYMQNIKIIYQQELRNKIDPQDGDIERSHRYHIFINFLCFHSFILSIWLEIFKCFFNFWKF